MSHSDYNSTAEEKYRALFDLNMIGVAISDLDEKIIEANDAFLHLVGYTRRDLQAGKLNWSAISPRKYTRLDHSKVHELLRRGTISPFEKEYLHKKGHMVPVVVGAARIRTNPPLSISFALDISPQKEVEQKKDEFIGTVSHELKTPLAVLKMYIHLLRRDLSDSIPKEKLHESLNEIDEQVDRLNLLITDQLNLARLEREKRLFKARLFDVRESAEEAVRHTRMISRRTIVLKNLKRECFIHGDREKIIQVLINFISNAVRYSPSHSKIVVSLTCKEKTVRINVQDFGMGIPKSNIPRIFERYYRIESAHKREKEGVGIGLYICQEIIRRHKGKIEVESTVGKGSTFSFILPLAEASPRFKKSLGKKKKRKIHA